MKDREYEDISLNCVDTNSTLISNCQFHAHTIIKPIIL